MNKEEESTSGDLTVVLRGLPWSAREADVQEFLKGFFRIDWLKFYEYNIMNYLALDVKVKDGSDGVHLITDRDGRPSGDAFIEVESEEDVERALALDHQNMGKRYIEGEMPT